MFFFIFALGCAGRGKKKIKNMIMKKSPEPCDSVCEESPSLDGGG
jgi:hypothetical protein